ncbi:uncharacterized protein LOC144622663 [Crassostrea virginica]
MVGYLLVSLLISVAPNLTWSCSDNLMFGYCLENSTVEQISNIGVHSCIKECRLRQPLCQSINYDSERFLCEINSREADIEVEGIHQTNSIFANVNGSSREALDNCQESFCSPLHKCVTSRTSHVCISTACQPGTYGKDGKCVPCPIGQFNSGGQWCLLCPLGTYEDGTGSSQCKQCPLGMYQDKIGSSQCKQCLPGTHEDGTGSSLCKQCPPGAYQDETGSSQCKQCAPGTYQPHHAQTSADSCLPCNAGKFQPNWGKHACWSCQPGSYQPDVGQTSCLPCPSGQYQNHWSQTQCIDCSRFTECVNHNRTSCRALRKRDRDFGYSPREHQGQLDQWDCRRRCRERTDCRAFAMARDSGPGDCWIFNHRNHYYHGDFDFYEFPFECHP